MDGLELARELRKLSQAEHVPIVGWTADWRSNPQEKVWRQAGLIDCLEEPVSMREPEAVCPVFFQ
jgi:CheY-like chemotaxis protein